MGRRLRKGDVEFGGEDLALRFTIFDVFASFCVFGEIWIGA